MDQIRAIEKILKAVPTIEGAGVYLKRVFGYHQVPDFDPFLLLDDFHSDDPEKYIAGFPWHPHRGIETITYVLQGDVAHGDSMGNRGTISAGDVQWMTAGSGIVHQEMPEGDADNRLWGFQLWANLPASHKMMPPRYRDVKNADIPEVVLDSGARVRIICGAVKGIAGPVRDIVIDPEYLDISVPAGSSFRHSVLPGLTVFAYVLEGEALFGRQTSARARTMTGAEHLLLYERRGNAVVIETENMPVRFLLVSGRPVGEPVAWGGPIVMNTQEELEIAFDEYERGTFLRHPKI